MQGSFQNLAQKSHGDFRGREEMAERDRAQQLKGFEAPLGVTVQRAPQLHEVRNGRRC